MEFINNIIGGSSYNKICITVARQKPMRRIIFGRGKNVKYYLSFPHLFYKVWGYQPNFQNQWSYSRFVIAAGFSERPEKVYSLPMGNVSRFDGVCLGSKVNNMFAPTMEELMHKAVKLFWSSKFLQLKSWDSAYHTELDYKTWHDKTKENQDWIPEETYFSNAKYDVLGAGLCIPYQKFLSDT